jgi:hypothetical protein
LRILRLISFPGFIMWSISHARLKAIGSVGDGMGCDGIEQLFVQASAECSVPLALHCNQWLNRPASSSFPSHATTRCLGPVAARCDSTSAQ